jgi:hypothetical protein
MFVFLKRIWISTNTVDNLLSIDQNFNTKTYKKCYNVDVLEGVVLWLLPSSMKAQRDFFCLDQSNC